MSLCLAAYQLIQEVVMIDLTEACLQTETGAATAAAAAECQRTSYDRPVLLCTEFMDRYLVPPTGSSLNLFGAVRVLVPVLGSMLFIQIPVELGRWEKSWLVPDHE